MVGKYQLSYSLQNITKTEHIKNITNVAFIAVFIRSQSTLSYFDNF